MVLNMSPLLLECALTLLIMKGTNITKIASLTMNIFSIVAILMMPISDQNRCAAVVAMPVKIQLAISIKMEMVVQFTQLILSIADYTILKAQRQWLNVVRAFKIHFKFQLLEFIQFKKIMELWCAPISPTISHNMSTLSIRNLNKVWSTFHGHSAYQFSLMTQSQQHFFFKTNTTTSELLL